MCNGAAVLGKTMDPSSPDLPELVRLEKRPNKTAVMGLRNEVDYVSCHFTNHKEPGVAIQT